jgi:hypothetical protein
MAESSGLMSTLALHSCCCCGMCPRVGLSQPCKRRSMPAGVRCMAIDGPSSDFARVGDADGRYRALMDELDADAVLLRPDFVLFGHARIDGLSELLRSLLSQLRCLSMPTPTRNVFANGLMTQRCIRGSVWFGSQRGLHSWKPETLSGVLRAR